MVLIANLSDDELKNDLDAIKAYAKSNGINIIPAIIKVEYELASLDESEQAEYLELLELCLEKGCEINENAVIDSILSGNINSVKLILKKYPELLTKTALETSKENKKKYPDIWTWIYWSMSWTWFYNGIQHKPHIV